VRSEENIPQPSAVCAEIGVFSVMFLLKFCTYKYLAKLAIQHTELNLFIFRAFYFQGILKDF
jgi:hypothetical protein